MKNKIKLIVCLILAMTGFATIFFSEYKTSKSVTISYAEESEIYGKKVDSSLIKDTTLRIWLNTVAQRKGLASMYDKMLNDEVEIDLSNQSILTLEGLENFYFDSLTELNLSYNAITIVPENAFYNMPNLKVLDLSHNTLASIDITLYAEQIDLSNNVLKTVEIQDILLKHLNLNSNNISDSYNIAVYKYDSVSGQISDLEPENYVITAYFNYMAGKTNLENAYLGLQNMGNYPPYNNRLLPEKEATYDYEMFADSKSYLFYVYPFEDVCVGIDEHDNLIYKHVACVLKKLNSETNTYEVEYIFSKVLNNETFDSFQPHSGIYKIEFMTYDEVLNVETGKTDIVLVDNIFKLNDEYQIVTEKDYNNVDVNVIDETFVGKSVVVRPYASANLYVKIGDDLYREYVTVKGPATVDFYTTIKNEGITYKYLIDGKGQGERAGRQIPYEGDSVTFEKAGNYVLAIWVIENGVASDAKNISVKVTVPKKMSFENWFYLIAGGILVMFGVSYYIIYRDRKNAKRQINDFEW